MKNCDVFHCPECGGTSFARYDCCSYVCWTCGTIVDRSGEILWCLGMEVQNVENVCERDC